MIGYTTARGMPDGKVWRMARDVLPAVHMTRRGCPAAAIDGTVAGPGTGSDSDSDATATRRYANPEVAVKNARAAEHRDDPKVCLGGSAGDVPLHRVGPIPGAVKIDWHVGQQDQIARDRIDKAQVEQLQYSRGIANDTTVDCYDDRNNGYATHTYRRFTLCGHADRRLRHDGRAKVRGGRPTSDPRSPAVPGGRAAHARGRPIEPCLPQRRAGPHAGGQATGGHALAGGVRRPGHPHDGEPAPGRGTARRAHPDGAGYAPRHRHQLRRHVQGHRRVAGNRRRRWCQARTTGCRSRPVRLHPNTRLPGWQETRRPADRGGTPPPRPARVLAAWRQQPPARFRSTPGVNAAGPTAPRGGRSPVTPFDMGCSARGG